MTNPIAAEPLQPPPGLVARLAEQQREYGTYEAAVQIWAGNALAFDVGHPVPISNVVAHGYWQNGQVKLQEGAEHAPEIAAWIAAQASPQQSTVVAALLDDVASDQEG